jgi:hypothetical protein
MRIPPALGKHRDSGPSRRLLRGYTAHFAETARFQSGAGQSAAFPWQAGQCSRGKAADRQGRGRALVLGWGLLAAALSTSLTAALAAFTQPLGTLAA